MPPGAALKIGTMTTPRQSRPFGELVMHAFVTLPFEAIFNPVYEACVRVAMRRGMETIRAKPAQVPAAAPIQSAAARDINRSRFVIADLTGSYPRALLEARYANQLGKPCILISQETPQKAAPHLDGISVHQYDLADLKSLQDVLHQLVGSLLNGDATFGFTAPLRGNRFAKVGMMNIGPQRWTNPFANGSFSC